MGDGAYYRLSDVNKGLKTPLPVKNAVATVVKEENKPIKSEKKSNDPKPTRKHRSHLPTTKHYAKQSKYQTLAPVMPAPSPPPPAIRQQPATSKKYQAQSPQQMATMKKLPVQSPPAISPPAVTSPPPKSKLQQPPSTGAADGPRPAKSGRRFLKDTSDLDGLFDDEEGGSHQEEKVPTEMDNAVSYSDPNYETMNCLPGKYDPFSVKQSPNAPSRMKSSVAKKKRSQKSKLQKGKKSTAGGRRFLKENSDMNGLFDDDEGGSNVEDKAPTEISHAVSYSDPKYETMACLPGTYDPFPAKQQQQANKTPSQQNLEERISDTPRLPSAMMRPSGGSIRNTTPASNSLLAKKKKPPISRGDKKGTQSLHQKQTSGRDARKMKLPENVKNCPPLPPSKMLARQQRLDGSDPADEDETSKTKDKKTPKPSTRKKTPEKKPSKTSAANQAIWALLEGGGGQQQPQSTAPLGPDNLPPNVKNCPPKSGANAMAEPKKGGKETLSNSDPADFSKKETKKAIPMVKKSPEKPKKSPYAELEELDDDDDEGSEPAGPVVGAKPGKMKKDGKKPPNVVNCPPLPSAGVQKSGTDPSDSSGSDGGGQDYEMLDPANGDATPPHDEK